MLCLTNMSAVEIVRYLRTNGGNLEPVISRKIDFSTQRNDIIKTIGRLVSVFSDSWAVHPEVGIAK